MDEDLTKLDELILNGGLEISTITDSGHFLYKFTDKLKDLDPELYEAVMQKMYEEVMFLWQNNFITMDITADNPVVTLTDKAFDDDALKELPDTVRANLIAVIKSLSEQS